MLFKIESKKSTKSNAKSIKSYTDAVREAKELSEAGKPDWNKSVILVTLINFRLKVILM